MEFKDRRTELTSTGSLATLQFKTLILQWLFNLGIDKISLELVHAIFFAMNEESTPCTGLLLPGQQFSLIGMGGKTVDGVNARPNRNLFAENSYLFGAINDATRESTCGSLANEHNSAIIAAQVVLQVMTHATTGTHA